MTLEDRLSRIETALKKAGLIEDQEYTLDRVCREAVKGNRKPLDEYCAKISARTPAGA
jgi:hypothetical protein